jgi:hypothetical protein
MRRTVHSGKRITRLQDFLLSKELFWPAGTQHGRRESVANLPQLSLGNIRLATARLLAKNENINDAALAGRIDPSIPNGVQIGGRKPRWNIPVVYDCGKIS